MFARCSGLFIHATTICEGVSTPADPVAMFSPNS